jgi:hypothetical protein
MSPSFSAVHPLTSHTQRRELSNGSGVRQYTSRRTDYTLHDASTAKMRHWRGLSFGTAVAKTISDLPSEPAPQEPLFEIFEGLPRTLKFATQTRERVRQPGDVPALSAQVNATTPRGTSWSQVEKWMDLTTVFEEV